jgi:hypothetical protein
LIITGGFMANTFIVLGERKVAASRIVNIKNTYTGIEVTLDDGSIYYLKGYTVEQIAAMVESDKKK